MLVIRLRRTGKKKRPSFRVIVAEKTMPIYGRFVDIIGNVNLQVQPKTINIDKEKALEWIKKGAKPSDTVARLMIKEGILKEEDVEKKPDKKRLKKKDQKIGGAAPSTSVVAPVVSEEKKTEEALASVKAEVGVPTESVGKEKSAEEIKKPTKEKEEPKQADKKEKTVNEKEQKPKENKDKKEPKEPEIEKTE